MRVCILGMQSMHGGIGTTNHAFVHELRRRGIFGHIWLPKAGFDGKFVKEFLQTDASTYLKGKRGYERIVNEIKESCDAVILNQPADFDIEKNSIKNGVEPVYQQYLYDLAKTMPTVGYICTYKLFQILQGYTLPFVRSIKKGFSLWADYPEDNVKLCPVPYVIRNGKLSYGDWMRDRYVWLMSSRNIFSKRCTDFLDLAAMYPGSKFDIWGVEEGRYFALVYGKHPTRTLPNVTEHLRFNQLDRENVYKNVLFHFNLIKLPGVDFRRMGEKKSSSHIEYVTLEAIDHGGIPVLSESWINRTTFLKPGFNCLSYSQFVESPDEIYKFSWEYLYTIYSNAYDTLLLPHDSSRNMDIILNELAQ